MQLNNIGTILSPFSLSNREVTLTQQAIFNNVPMNPVYVYSLLGSKPKYYLTSTYKQVRFMEEYGEEAGKADALSSYDAFLTTNRKLIPTKENGVITVISDAPTEKKFSIQADTDTFFVGSLYLYPGWEARLDDKKTLIEPANISGMAIFIPKGTHTLVLQFIPNSLYLGGLITGITLIIYGWVIIRSFSHTS